MIQSLKDYIARGSLIAKKIDKYMRTPKVVSLLYKAVFSFSVGLLLLTSVYAGYHASNAYSTNSNAVMLTQMFGKNIEYPVTLPGPHATLLIIPVVYIQGQLPYHYTSFTLVNMGLVLATMIAWAFLLIKLFGRRYEVPILIILSSLVFTSVAFSLSLAYTTIRNIEYPIVLWFVLIVSDLLRRATYTRKQLILAAIGTILFIVTLAGDSFFNYAILLPLLFVIAWYWAQSREFTVNMVKALGLIAGTVIGAALLKLILSKAGIIHFDYGYWGANGILQLDRLGPSLSVALTQVMEFNGGFIFGQIINSHNLAIFVNFGLLLASVVGLILILIKANRSYRLKKGLTTDNNFVFVTMAVSFFVVFLIYALSGYAIATIDGQIVSGLNARYISLMPLVSVIGLVWLLKNYYKKHLALICLVCAVLVVGIVTSYQGVSTAYSSGSKQLELAPSRSTINETLTILQNNGVSKIMTDYWYGHVLRFWSADPNLVASQAGCSSIQPSTLNSPDGKPFTQQRGINTALIIDRDGLNYGFWTCTDAQLIEMYGTPNKEFEVPGAAAGTVVKIWIYENADR